MIDVVAARKVFKKWKSRIFFQILSVRTHTLTLMDMPQTLSVCFGASLAFGTRGGAEKFSPETLPSDLCAT